MVFFNKKRRKETIMNLQILAQNIRRLRTAKRLSQSALADAAGLSLPAIKNLELAKNEPRMRTVQAIARALGVKLQELFLPVRELRAVRFRSVRRMQNRENVLAEVARWLDDFSYLEKVLNNQMTFSLKPVRAQCSRNRLSEAAGLCRKKLGLKPTEPIHDICGLLESAGVKVFPVPMASDGFFGMSVGEESGGPAVVVNAWERIPVERQIFSAAHELGHLMLEDVIADGVDIEKVCHRFAAAFLVPSSAVRQEMGGDRNTIYFEELHSLKHKWGLSMSAWLRRLADLAIISQSEYALCMRMFSKRGWRRREPGKPVEPEHTGRLERLVQRAVAEDIISVSRAADFLNRPLIEVRRELGWPAGGAEAV